MATSSDLVLSLLCLSICEEICAVCDDHSTDREIAASVGVVL